MSRCGKRITRTSYLRDSAGKMTGETKQVDTPGISYTCDIQIEGDPHEGPCASSSDNHSVAMRQKWETDNEVALAMKRHAASGLAVSQSLPMTVASIVSSDSLSPHPSAEARCPFCSERPLNKFLSAHIATHAAEAQYREQRITEREELDPDDGHIVPSIDMDGSYPLLLKKRAQVAVIQSWINTISNIVFVPRDVKEALQSLAQ